MTSSKATPRYPIVDQIRGLAVILMVVFHTLYDLRWFGYLPSDFPMRAFAQVIVFLFLTAMGLSLPLAHSRGIRWRSFGKRSAKLALAAGAISLATYLLFPTRWIYFGILHCILVCSFLALPLIGHPRLAGLSGVLILVPALLGFRYPWIRMDHSSLDFVPALPWVGVVLLGIWWQALGLHRWRLPDWKFMRWMAFLGRWSLWIYLLHQPVIYGLIYTLSRFIALA